MKHLMITMALVTCGFFAKANTAAMQPENREVLNKPVNIDNVVAVKELRVFLFSKANTEVLKKLNGKTSDEMRNLTKEAFAAFVMSCFDFYDSCGGSWRVCHEGVSTQDLIAFLWEWDGGC